jgi:asparagine synthase (glutamine-hydrolysing)
MWCVKNKALRLFILIGNLFTKLLLLKPDDSGIWLNKNIGFGHQRLSIIDLSNHAHQPMVDDTLGLSLVFNGTIYKSNLN